MSAGRAPRPRFAAECRKIIGPALAPLGFVAQPASGEYARFDSPHCTVEVSWDAYDVMLTAKLDGVAIDLLLRAAGLRAESAALASDDPPLRDVASALVALLARPSIDDAVASTRATLEILSQGTDA